jgi:Uma2 family endonuclease
LSGRPKFVYPDITVICGEPISDAEDTQGETYLNPTAIVEVLSPTTERYDRKGKFDRYRAVESFREYVLISQEAARVELFHRQPDGTWSFDVAVGLDSVARFRSLDVEVPLTEIYTGVTFPPEIKGPELAAES